MIKYKSCRQIHKKNEIHRKALICRIPRDRTITKNVCIKRFHDHEDDINYTFQDIQKYIDQIIISNMYQYDHHLHYCPHYIDIPPSQIFIDIK